MNTPMTASRPIPYATLDGQAGQLPAASIAAFAAGIGGGVITPDDAAYEEARKVWNATVDRRPALIARCLSEHDVQAAVRFAATHRMLLSVRGGGHHIAGNAVAEGGLMIDLSGLRSVEVDPSTRSARVLPLPLGSEDSLGSTTQPEPKMAAFVSGALRDDRPLVLGGMVTRQPEPARSAAGSPPRRAAAAFRAGSTAPVSGSQ